MERSITRICLVLFLRDKFFFDPITATVVRTLADRDNYVSEHQRTPIGLLFTMLIDFFWPQIRAIERKNAGP
jgi:hypothetical protein